MPQTDYTPTVQDVANLLRARTRDDDGNEVGTFDTTTRPTGAQTTALIADAAGQLSLVVGDEIPAVLREETKTVAKMMAAMMIELSYFPEQIVSGRSAYAQYKDYVDERVGTPDKPGSLIQAIRNALKDQSVDVMGSRISRGSFPKVKILRW